MTRDEPKALKPGDSVQRLGDLHHTYVVTANYGDRVTAVRSVHLTNPIEWVRIKHAYAPARYVGKDSAQFQEGQLVYVDPHAFKNETDIVWAAVDPGGRDCYCHREDVAVIVQ